LWDNAFTRVCSYKVRENSSDAKLKDAQDVAKAAGKGVWGGDSADHVRKITWDMDNPRQVSLSLLPQLCKILVDVEPNCSRTFRKKLEFVKFEHFS
jgi:hypothetical protein